jgi:hypothetical protein
MENIVRFVALTQGARLPVRADPTLQGSMSLRAYRFCEPFVQASGYGWTMFSPIDFRIIWDGSEFSWKPEGYSKWMPFSEAQMPGYSEWFAKNAPEDFRRLELPFLTAFPERGVVQIWTGYVAKTRANWSLLLRGPANQIRSATYFNLEGIVEHDWWFGPVLGNLQFTIANKEVRFTRSTPLLLAQPVLRQAYSTELLGSVDAKNSIESLSVEDWTSFEQALFFGADEKPVGSYARIARKRSDS